MGLRLPAAGTLYQQLVETIDRSAELSELALLISYLGRCTGLLHKNKHSELISVVLRRCFRGHNDLTAAVEAFAVNSVSVNADLLASILHELVKHFVKFDLLAVTPPDAEKAAMRAVWGEEDGRTREEQVQAAQKACAVHRVTKRVLETFPTGTMAFLDQLKQAYPHHVRPIGEQRAFLSNILRVSTYQPQLLPEIWEIVVDRLIKLDVTVDPAKLEALNHCNSGALDITDEDELFGLEMEETSEEGMKMLESAGKLDAMMHIILQFWRDIMVDHTQSRESKDLMFKSLLNTFFPNQPSRHSKILTTFRSKYVQFLVFYACHFQNQYSKDFLQLLIVKIIDSSTADTLRHAAGSYLGSFLARAKYLKLANIELSLRLLVTWVLEYMDKECPYVTGPDPNHHSLFYNLVQGLFYVLCFRLPQLMGAENGKYDTFLRLELRLRDIILCPLNPLKVVDQGVGHKFMTLAVKYRLIETHVLRDLLEYNKTLIVNGIVEFEEEHSYFPFDTYNLVESRQLIEGGAQSSLYQKWEEAADDIFTEDDASGAGWRDEREESEGPEESIAMSLTSQLSISEHQSSASPSSNWRPMSFSPNSCNSEFLQHAGV